MLMPSSWQLPFSLLPLLVLVLVLLLVRVL
jgi:hypothetical protein